jgi:hypothetical protein
MPKANVRLGEFADIEPAAGFTDYTGPVPPAGLYHCTLKWMKLTKNGSGDPMFKVIFEVSEPKGSEKAKYNGYAIWHNANITRVGAPYLNAMLDALGLGRSDDIILSDDGGKEERVVKIGRKKVDGLTVLVNTKRKEWPEDSGDWTLAARAFASTGNTVSVEKDAEPDSEPDAEPDAWDVPDDGDSF